MAKKWTDEELVLVASLCASRRVMREKYPSALLQIYRRGLSEAAFSHMEKERQYVKDGSDVKICKSCNQVKITELFYKDSRGGFRSICKSCSNTKSTEWRKANPERAREIVNKSAKSKPDAVRNRQKVKRIKNPHVFAARDMLKRVLSITNNKKTTKTEVAIGYSFTDLKNHIQSQFKDGMSWENWGEWHIDHIYPVASMVKDGITDPAKINALSNLRPLWAYENMSRPRR